MSTINIIPTKYGCEIIRDTKEHDECICDENGQNWICADCYTGEYEVPDLKTILEEVSFEDLCEYVMDCDGSDVSEGWDKECLIEMIIEMSLREDITDWLKINIG